jgi:uncharacterized protein (DUF362 family)
MNKIPRRKFLLLSGVLFHLLATGCLVSEKEGDNKAPKALKKVPKEAEVYVAKTGDRAMIGRLLDLLSLNVKDVEIALKANYNSADPFPATTHPDTLKALVTAMRNKGSDDIVLAERSGMDSTRYVLKELGIFDLSEKLGFTVIVLDGLGGDSWIRINPENTHWGRGFLLAKVFAERTVIQTCCLKTHRFGGHFTMSLKNSVGMVAKYDPIDGYDYMGELHRSPHQRKMIAEINTAYSPDAIVMDAIQGFSTGGPDTGTLIEPGLLLASRDRVAMDAVGVALLRLYGTTREVSAGEIFQQEQIARAVELGLGVPRAEDIKLIPVNGEAENPCENIRNMLGGEGSER